MLKGIGSDDICSTLEIRLLSFIWIITVAAATKSDGLERLQITPDCLTNVRQQCNIWDMK